MLHDYKHNITNFAEGRVYHNRASHTMIEIENHLENYHIPILSQRVHIWTSNTMKYLFTFQWHQCQYDQHPFSAIFCLIEINPRNKFHPLVHIWTSNTMKTYLRFNEINANTIKSIFSNILPNWNQPEEKISSTRQLSKDKTISFINPIHTGKSWKKINLPSQHMLSSMGNNIKQFPLC